MLKRLFSCQIEYSRSTSVCDIGCGPGHVARYLRSRGLDVMGVDLSARMVEHASRLNEGITFVQGDMSSLAFPDGARAAVVAFYSIIHIARDQVVPTLRELRRVLRPGGALLIAFHVGTDTIHLDEWWGHRVSAHFQFFEPDEMSSFLREAGFRVDGVSVREPYPEVEHQSRRAYIAATPTQPRRASPSREPRSRTHDDGGIERSPPVD